MRLLVVGAGAIGGYFGARLLQAGRDVTFLVRPRRAELLAKHGLRVESPLGDVHISSPATITADRLRGGFDAVLLSCKAYDLETAIADIAPAVTAGAVVLPLLNGMRHMDVLDARFGRASVLGGQCVISTTLKDDGTIVHLNTVHSLTFAARDGEAAGGRVAELTEQLSGGGFDAIASDAISQAMWEKWVTLASMAGATCLMRASLAAINRAEGGTAFVLGLLQEVTAVAERAGHPPRPEFLDATRAFLTNRDAPQTSSMFRDIEQGARIEGDHIIGDLLRRAKDAGSPHDRLAVVHAHLSAYEARLAEAAET